MEDVVEEDQVLRISEDTLLELVEQGLLSTAEFESLLDGQASDELADKVAELFRQRLLQATALTAAAAQYQQQQQQ